MISTSNLLAEIQQAIKDAEIVQGNHVFIEDVDDSNWDGSEQLNIYEYERRPIGHQVGVCGYECTVVLQAIAQTKDRVVSIIKESGNVIENLNIRSEILKGEEVGRTDSGTKIHNSYLAKRQYTIFTIGE